MPIRSFHDLHVWQRSVSLVEQTYAIIRALPVEERAVLGDQMRRAATSIPANIAEGYMRYHRKEYLQFLAIAHGSLGELETHLIVGTRVGSVSRGVSARALATCEEVSRMLHVLRARLGQAASNRPKGSGLPRPSRPAPTEPSTLDPDPSRDEPRSSPPQQIARRNSSQSRTP